MPSRLPTFSVHRPRRAIDAAGESRRGSRVLCLAGLCLIDQWPDDVFHAARLTLRPWIAARRVRRARRTSSYVEGIWSPSLALAPEKDRRKHTLIASVYFQRAAPRAFLSQAGPRFGLELVQAGITSGSDVWSIALEQQKGDPLGRPRPAGYAARNLVRTPPGEGLSATGLEPRIEVRPARVVRRARRRSGLQRWGVVCDEHRDGGLCRVGE
jgi:hypothetical protein